MFNAGTGSVWATERPIRISQRDAVDVGNVEDIRVPGSHIL